MSKPRVSIIIPAYFSHATIGACLEALRQQTFSDFETIVVDSTPDNRTAIFVSERFPEVRIHHHPTRLLPHEARNIGAGFAQGGVLVFSDPDCIPCADWLRYLVAGHETGYEAVGGAVGCEGGWWNLAVHMTKYAWWLPGSQPEARLEMASANSSISRKLWNTIGSYKSQYFAGDSELSWRIRASSRIVWFEPRALVTHIHRVDVASFVKERYRRGQDFGSMRTAVNRWTRRRIAVYVILLPLLPVAMTARAAGYALRSRHFLQWLVTIPVQLAGAAAWCLGEATSHWMKMWGRRNRG